MGARGCVVGADEPSSVTVGTKGRFGVVGGTDGDVDDAVQATLDSTGDT